MENKIKKQLKKFCAECQQYLNKEKLTFVAGKYNIELSTRTLSDVIEKNVISFIIDYFGEENVQYGNYSGYDVIILDLESQTVYINIKTALANQNLDATWLCSASVIERIEKEGVTKVLYCVKFEYEKGEECLNFVSAKIAGAVSSLNLIRHTKGEKSKYKIRTEFNGTHCHILNEDYE